jgi:shikimate dehydrogenase
MGADPLIAGLLGWPLRTSLSPSLHQAFLRLTGIRGSYSLVPVEPGRLSEAIRELYDRGFSGLNVTVPHKTAAMRECSELDRSATEAGAVNTLLRTSSGWKGFNTDSEGFGRVIGISGLLPAFAVVGCGGAGRAVSAELRSLGLEHRVFCGSRSMPGSEPLEALAGYACDPDCSTVVNATPLGWADGDTFPLDAWSLRGKAFLDLNYNPGWAWRNALREEAALVVTGELMLASQAAASFRIWTGVTPDAGRALEEAFGQRDGGHP